MAKHVTFRGTQFNMTAFADQHGDVTAVGNSSRNARGDVIDRTGKVVATAQQVNAAYNSKNPKAVAKVSINQDPNERLASQAPKAAKPAPAPAKPAPAKPAPVAPSVAATAVATADDPSQHVVNRRVFMDQSGEEKTEITYADGSVEVI
jgi:hypothetical protein